MQLPTEIFGYQIPWNDIFATKDALWQFILSNQEAIWIGLLGLVVAIIVFLLVREFLCWYWKISGIIRGQKVGNALLNEQNDLIAENNSLLTTLISETTALRQEMARVSKKETGEEPVVKKIPPKPKSAKATPKSQKNPTE